MMYHLPKHYLPCSTFASIVCLLGRNTATHNAYYYAHTCQSNYGAKTCDVCTLFHATHRKGNAVNVDGHGALAGILIVVVLRSLRRRRRDLLLGSEGVGNSAKGIGQRGCADLGAGAGAGAGSRRLGSKCRRRRNERGSDGQSRDRLGADEHGCWLASLEIFLDICRQRMSCFATNELPCSSSPFFN